MLHVAVHVTPDPQQPLLSRRQMILNGRIVPTSYCTSPYKGENMSAGVGDPAASRELMGYPVRELAQRFDRLSLVIEPASHGFLSHVTFVSRDTDGKKLLALDFDFDLRPEHWARPWSMAEYGEVVRRLVEACEAPGLAFLDDRPRPQFSITLRGAIRSPSFIARDEVEYWTTIVSEICADAEGQLVTTRREDALVTLFQFPPEVRSACEQYLLYFVQFLQDLGVKAHAGLSEEAEGTLFTVIPEAGPEALKQIHDALEAYLQLPSTPSFDIAVGEFPDMAVQQLRSNIYHLKGQLTLAEAALHSRSATIASLEATVLQYRAMIAGDTKLLPASPQLTPSVCEGEDFLGGALTIMPVEGKGFRLNLPHIIRNLRRHRPE